MEDKREQGDRDRKMVWKTPILHQKTLDTFRKVSAFKIITRSPAAFLHTINEEEEIRRETISFTNSFKRKQSLTKEVKDLYFTVRTLRH